jgi:hypothetical protein
VMMNVPGVGRDCGCQVNNTRSMADEESVCISVYRAPWDMTVISDSMDLSNRRRVDAASAKNGSSMPADA